MKPKRDEDARTRLRRVTSKMMGSPFFPILFIGEAVKIYFLNGYAIHAPSPETIRLLVIGVLSMVLYVVGDDLYAEFEGVGVDARERLPDGDGSEDEGGGR